MNYLDKDFDVSSMDEDTSAGVALAKKIILSYLIPILYVLCFLALAFLYIKPNYEIFINDTFDIFCVLSAVTFYIAIFCSIRIFFNKAIHKLSIEDSIDFDVYMYHKFYKRIRGFRLATYISLARLEAIKGNVEQCKYVIGFLGNRKYHDTDIVKEWLKNSEIPIDQSLFKKKAITGNIFLTLIFLALSYTCFFNSFDSEVLIAAGLSSHIIHFSQAIEAISIAFCYTLIIAIIVLRSKHKNFARAVIGCFFLIAMFVSFVIYYPDFRNLLFEDTGSDSYNEEYSDYYSYDDSYLEDDSIDASSEPMNDLDIMNNMIVLCQYLKEEGLIEDYYSNLNLSYTAKGNVRGTVYSDEDYEYNLYDNGTKKDENGNECLELVLEAEPLDENGNSLGQAEASLKGFYLINLGTNEILDEHKTHW